MGLLILLFCSNSGIYLGFLSISTLQDTCELNKSGMAFAFQDQMQMRIVCPGRVSAMATSPDALYCVAAIGEKIHVWQVCLGFSGSCVLFYCRIMVQDISFSFHSDFHRESHGCTRTSLSTGQLFTFH